MAGFFLRAYSLISPPVCRLKSGLVRGKIIKPAHSPIPVISVGNLTLGGSEKTPLVMEIISYLTKLGLKPALVARGYRGGWEKTGGVLSDGKTLFGTWEQGGDEPAMIARRFPKAGVFVGKDRARSCRKAHNLGFDVAILDDGFQHLRLARDIDIVLHDDRSSAGRREGFAALRRADILLWKKGGRRACLEEIRRTCPLLSIFEYGVKAQGLGRLGTAEIYPVEALKSQDVFAFCGIARPGRFFALLEEYGLTLKARTCYPDHFPYPEQALDRLGAAYRESGATAFLTTEKDAIKLEGRAESLSPIPVYFLKIGLDVPEAFFERIRDVLQGPGSTHA
jgi:tetraacyldisaccharide 4'-kinase